MAGREDLLARLLADPAFRAEFNRDPAAAAHRLGLEGFDAAANPLEALNARESRSSLASVMLGLAAEGVGLFALTDHADAATGPQFGADAAHHDPTPETVTLLHHHNVTFDADGVADLQAGRIDPRVVAVLGELARDHRITVSAMCSDHPKLTTGGSISNHYYGRAVDIATIDGQPVGPGNAAAKAIAVALNRLDPSVRPTEIGSPWTLPGAAYFTDAEHQNHLHIGYDDPLSPDWHAPTEPDAPEHPAAGPDQHRSGVASLDDEDTDGDNGDDDGGDEDGDDGGDADPHDDDEDDAGGGDGNEDRKSTRLDSSHPADAAAADDARAAHDALPTAPAEADAPDHPAAGDDDHRDGEAGDDDEDDDDDDGDDDDGGDEDEDEPDEDEPDEDEDDSDDGDDSAGSGDGDDSDSGNSDDPDSDVANGGDSHDGGDSDDGDDSDDSDDADRPDDGGGAAAWDDPGVSTSAYPGDGAPRSELAAWMAGAARARGLPSELPVMAALVESNLANLNYGDADSVGFFQMRAGIWNQGAYVGYAQHPERQLDWFLDQAEGVKKQRLARGLAIDDPRQFGEWIADIERPAAQYRGRYQLQLEGARGLLEQAGRARSGAAVKLHVITPEQARNARR